jgi:hypothetical protein
VEHNHEPDVEREVVLKSTTKAKTRGDETKEKPRTIIVAVEKELDRFEAAKMTRKQNLGQIIKRVRKNKPDRQPDPICITSLTLPDKLKVTHSGIQFYYDTNGVVGNGEILMFATDPNIKILKKYDLYCDGTFDVAPSICKQLYTVHVIVESKLV